MSLAFRTASDADALDIGLLGWRDRAALRILDRAEAATARQLAILAYGHRRVAQRRLARLWQAGLLERAVLPPVHRGGAELAYRLSRRAQHQLGDRSMRARGSSRLGHTLDIVEAVCALVTASADPRAWSPVSLWLTEPMARTHLGGPPYPDSIVVLADGRRSGVICLEVDHATQRRAVIAAKLAAYRLLRQRHPEWQTLFVVPSAARARWLLRLFGSAHDDLVASTWITTLPALCAAHVAAPIVPIRGRLGQAAVRDLLTDSAPRSSVPSVASGAWLQLLGEGGGEDRGDGLP
jgi:hypothetical protein